MVTKKFFALASVSAVAGLIMTVAASGCSTTTTTTEETPADGGGTDSGRTPREGGAGDAGGDEPECPLNDPSVDTALMDKEVGFKAPTANSAGSCSAEDLTKFEANTKTQGLTSFYELATGVSDKCKSCIISDDDAANWQVIVATKSDGGKTGLINWGACFAGVEGEACGKSVLYSDLCVRVACDECAPDGTANERCVDKASSDGMCKQFFDAVGTNCPKIGETAAKCDDLINSVKTLCGPAT